MKSCVSPRMLNRTLARALVFLILATAMFGNVMPARAAANDKIHYQGKLFTSAGSPVADGTHSMVFSFYNVATGGSNIWTETQTITTSGGLFNVLLGSVVSLSGINWNQALYLGVTVDTDTEMTPRHTVGAVPAAHTIVGTLGVAQGGTGTNTQFASGAVLFAGASGAYSGNANQLFINSANGYVGIGTASPAGRLTVGSTGVDGVYQDILTGLYTVNNLEKNSIQSSVSTIGGQSGFRFQVSNGGSTSTQTLGYQLNRDSHHFYTSGTEKVTINSSGDVGIGTTNPVAGLDVKKNVMIGSGTTTRAALGLTLGTTHAGTYSANSDISDASRQLSIVNNGSVANTFAALSMRVNPGGGANNAMMDMKLVNHNDGTSKLVYSIGNNGVFTDAMTILSSGNVGIGTTTSTAKLFVNGDIATNGALSLLDNNYSLTTGVGNVITLSLGTEEWVKLATMGNKGTYNIGYEISSTNSEEEGSIQVMATHFANQSVINVNRQSYNPRLSEVRITGNDGGNKTIYVRVRTSVFAPTMKWRIFNAKGTIVSVDNTISTPGSAPATTSSLMVDGNQTASTNATISTLRDVGIGTTTPGAKLHIAAAGAFAILQDTASASTSNALANFLSFRDSGGSEYGWVGDGSSGDNMISLHGNVSHGLVLGAGGLRRMYITPSGDVGIGTSTPTAQFHTTGSVRFQNFGAGTLTTDASGNLTVSSDERLKDVEGSFTNGLAAIRGIEPIRYRWNATSGLETENIYAGFSAQNVMNSIEEAVGVDKNTGYFTLNDRPILAASVNAIKEIDSTLESLASTSAATSAKDGTRTFVGRFFDRMVAWFADTANGIGNFFAKSFRAQETICVGNTCVNESQLEALLANSGSTSSSNNYSSNAVVTSGGGSSATSTASSTVQTATSTDATASSTPDTAAPVITLSGDATITLTVGDTFTDPGATATDETDTAVTVVVTGTVDTGTAGDYTLTYNAADTAGNTATPVTRTVTVATALPPPGDSSGTATSTSP